MLPRNVLQLIQSEPLQVAAELVVIWLLVYLVFRFLRGTRGAGVVKGFVVLLVVATLTIRVLGQGGEAFARLTWIYGKFLTGVTVLLVVVFQPELRQAMIRIGHAWSFRTGRGSMRTVIAPIAEAVAFLSKAQFGALVAIERTNRLGGLIETGTTLDARLSARLLESIFWPNSPLHDLGVIVRVDRIVAASVQFPLAEEGVLADRYGSRHRAAVGLSVESDCLVIIVSEETGAISIAEGGRLESDIPREEFATILALRLQAPTEPSDRDEEPPAADSDTEAPTGSSEDDEGEAPSAAARVMG